MSAATGHSTEAQTGSVTVTRLQVTAVKGFQVRELTEATFTPDGVPGDRAFAVVDERDEVLTVGRTAAFLPFWSSLAVDEDLLTIGRGDDILMSRQVATGQSLRVHFFGDRYGIGELVLGPWREFLSDLAGKDVRLVRTSGPLGGYDVHPVTLVSEASVNALGQDADGASLDGRRFRMTMTLDGLPAFGEDALQGRKLVVGRGGCSILVGGPVKRCAAVQRHPTGLPLRVNTLGRINDIRGIGDSELGRGLNLGAYGVVASPGRVSAGDRVRIEPPADKAG
jgi:uncharacterized protein